MINPFSNDCFQAFRFACGDGATSLTPSHARESTDMNAFRSEGAPAAAWRVPPRKRQVGRAVLGRIRTLALGFGVAICAALPLSAQETGPLLGTSYGKGEEAVVVFLHGDLSRGGPATYHQSVMRSLSDKAGNNHKRWDQYTAANNDLLAETLQGLRTAHPDSRLVVAGHSGGAAQLGAVIGRYPGLVDTAVLISCPCDFPTWRKGGRRKLVRSADQNPQDLISGIDRATRILAVTGKRDKNTFPALARAYIAAAQAAGLDAHLELVPGADHWNGTLKERVIEILLEEVAHE